MMWQTFSKQRGMVEKKSDNRDEKIKHDHVRSLSNGKENSGTPFASGHGLTYLDEEMPGGVQQSHTALVKSCLCTSTVEMQLTGWCEQVIT